MITRAQKIRLGIFILVSGVLLFGTLGMLAGLRALEQRDAYTVRFSESVSGLEPGAQVEYNGVRVGRVDDIRIDREDVSKVVVRLSLEEGTPIKEDTKAVLKSTGITGLQTVELLRGSREADLLEPGSEIPSDSSTHDRLTGHAEAIGQKAELALNRFNKILDKENRARISSMLDSGERILEGTAEMVEENRGDVRTLVSSLAQLGSRMDDTVVRVEQQAVATLEAVQVAAEDLQGVVDKDKVDAILARVDALAANANRAVTDLEADRISADVQAMVKRAERMVANLDLTIVKSREDIFASLDYLVEGLEDFSDFTRMVRENPALLLKGPQEAERER